MGSMFDQMIAESAAHRHLTVDQMHAIVDRAPITASDGLKSHLVDRLEYEDRSTIASKNIAANITKPSKRPPMCARPARISAAATGSPWFMALARFNGAPAASIPFLAGSEAMGSDDIVKAFKDAREDDGIRAVVFRVDSPGGSVIASELIRRAVELTAAKKPRSSAWRATPPRAVIGSRRRPPRSSRTPAPSPVRLACSAASSTSGAATALGVNTGSVSRGANALMFDSFSDFTPAQSQIFRDQLLGGTYQYFLEIVAKQRHMTVAQVNDVAQGRVWTGDQALKVKLVDKLGGLSDAIDRRGNWPILTRPLTCKSWNCPRRSASLAN